MSELARVDVKQLRVLEAIVRLKNLSRVAEELGVTQQAVSGQLKRLRSLFDDHLVVRTSNGVVPTPRAEALAPRARGLLAELEALLDDGPFDPAAIRRDLVLSATDYAQRVVLPALVELLRSQAPGVRLIVRDIEVDDLHELMVAGAIDLVLTTPDFLPEHYPSLVLFEEEYCCVGSKQRFPRSRRLTLESLAGRPHLVVSPARANLRGSADAWFRAHGLGRDVRLALPGFAALPDCLEAGDYLAFVPSRLLPHPALQTLRLDAYPPGFSTVLGWHTRSGQDPLLGWIRERLQQRFA